MNIPEGFMRNALGHLVPIEQVREQDKLRDQIANDLAATATALNKSLRLFKQQALTDINDLIDIAASRYEVTLGGKKGNITVASFDGQYKVQRVYANLITFTEEIEAAKALIIECIDRWSEGANANIRALVDRAFRTNKNGQLKTSEILGLLRLDIDDDNWKRAMTALKDSIQVSGTAVYIRVYERVGDSDQYRPIPLDLATV